MNEAFVSRCAVWASVFWAKSVGLLAAVWVAAAHHVGMEWVIALATTFVFTATIAATIQVRSYMVRLCAVIRATAGIEAPQAKVRALR